MTIELSNVKGTLAQMDYLFDQAETFSVRHYEPSKLNDANWNLIIRCSDELGKTIKAKRSLNSLISISKKAITLTKGIAFRSENGGSSSVEEIGLTFTPTDILRIQKAIKFCKKNDFVFSVKLEFDGFEYLTDEGEQTTEWRSDVQNLIVYSNAVYFYAQSKWDAGDQLETEEITLESLGI